MKIKAEAQPETRDALAAATVEAADAQVAILNHVAKDVLEATLKVGDHLMLQDQDVLHLIALDQTEEIDALVQVKKQLLILAFQDLHVQDVRTN